LRDRDPGALEEARARLRETIDELCYVQWVADSQWRAGRAVANGKGVKILGDLPFMVAEDSADVWSFQRFFRFDATVGVPPDAYAAEGQDWGLPVPRWEEMRSAGDPWLHHRADRAAELYDAFRVDHVVGLYRTYARPVDKGPPFFIPADEPRQREQGERILALLGGKAEVLAEDLGVVPDCGRASLATQEFPGAQGLRWVPDLGVPRALARLRRAPVAGTAPHALPRSGSAGACTSCGAVWPQAVSGAWCPRPGSPGRRNEGAAGDRGAAGPPPARRGGGRACRRPAAGRDLPRTAARGLHVRRR